MSNARLRAQKKYDEAHRKDYRSYQIKCNKQTDKDIINYLDGLSNKQAFIKKLIRAHIG